MATEKKIQANIQIKRDTQENWETKNPVLKQGEPCLDITNNILKIGQDKKWNDTPATNPPADWNQNDSSQLDYIKNRIGYIEEISEPITNWRKGGNLFTLNPDWKTLDFTIDNCFPLFGKDLTIMMNHEGGGREGLKNPSIYSGDNPGDIICDFEGQKSIVYIEWLAATKQIIIHYCDINYEPTSFVSMTIRGLFYYTFKGKKIDGRIIETVDNIDLYNDTVADIKPVSAKAMKEHIKRLDDIALNEIPIGNNLHGFKMGYASEANIIDDNSIAIGNFAKAFGGIQLGIGENNNKKSLQVYDKQLMDGEGIIPTDRFPQGIRELPTKVDNFTIPATPDMTAPVGKTPEGKLVVKEGLSAGFGTPTASIDNNTGTPSVSITASGSNTAKIFNFDFKNLKGETGPKGDTGSQGPRGLQGPPGEKGATGAQGNPGAQGPKGNDGAKGERGATGPKGNDGTSVTHSWSGTKLTITSASGTTTADLQGPQGLPGKQGPTGPKGDDAAVDQTFNTQSTHAQSGKAIDTHIKTIIEGTPKIVVSAQAPSNPAPNTVWIKI